MESSDNDKNLPLQSRSVVTGDGWVNSRVGEPGRHQARHAGNTASTNDWNILMEEEKHMMHGTPQRADAKGGLQDQVDNSLKFPPDTIKTRDHTSHDPNKNVNSHSPGRSIPKFPVKTNTSAITSQTISKTNQPITKHPSPRELNNNSNFLSGNFQNKTNALKKKPKYLTMSELYKPLSWSQYITLTFPTAYCPSVFRIDELLQSIFIEATPTFSINNNIVTIKSPSEEMSNKLLKIETLDSISVKASDKNCQNQRTGTTLLSHFHPGPSDSDEYICKRLEARHHRIESVFIFSKLNRRTQKPLKIVKIIFNQQSLPTHINFLNGRIPIREEIPLPMQCRTCLRFGHTLKRCLQTSTCCFRCGSHDHSKDSCTSPLKCYNCNATHHAFSRSCPHFSYHQEILLRTIKYGITRRQAKIDMKQEGRTLSSQSWASVVTSSVMPQKSLQTGTNKNASNTYPNNTSRSIPSITNNSDSPSKIPLPSRLPTSSPKQIIRPQTPSQKQPSSSQASKRPRSNNSTPGSASISPSTMPKSQRRSSPFKRQAQVEVHAVCSPSHSLNSPSYETQGISNDENTAYSLSSPSSLDLTIPPTPDPIALDLQNIMGSPLRSPTSASNKHETPNISSSSPLEESAETIIFQSSNSSSQSPLLSPITAATEKSSPPHTSHISSLYKLPFPPGFHPPHSELLGNISPPWTTKHKKKKKSKNKSNPSPSKLENTEESLQDSKAQNIPVILNR